MTKYDVYGVGNALVDIEFEVTPEQLSDLNIDKGAMTLVDELRQAEIVRALGSQESNRGSGGSAANSVIAVSQFGGRAFYSCHVADDEMGHFYVEDLRRAGVDTGIETHRMAKGVTGKCLVLVTPDADRTMITFLGASANISAADVDESAIADSEFAYVEGYLVTGSKSNEAALFAVDRARSHGTKVAFSLSDQFIVEHFRPAVDALIGDGVDMPFANEQEAKSVARTEELDQAIEFLTKIAKQFVVTCGPDGAVVYDGQSRQKISAVPTQAIDTVGAGDMFAGAFLYGITQGMSHIQSGGLASLAASRIVSSMGPRLTLEDVQAVLKAFSQD